MEFSTEKEKNTWIYPIARLYHSYSFFLRCRWNTDLWLHTTTSSTWKKNYFFSHSSPFYPPITDNYMRIANIQYHHISCYWVIISKSGFKLILRVQLSQSFIQHIEWIWETHFNFFFYSMSDITVYHLIDDFSDKNIPYGCTCK